MFFFKDRKYYRLNQRSMLRSSEDFFAVLAVTLQKASRARNRKLFLAEVSKEVSSARRGNFKEKNFIRRESMSPFKSATYAEKKT